MKETLILLTSSFPFGSGETFLETELPYLADSFSKVVIIPTKKISSSNARPIPKNCFINDSIVLRKQSENLVQRLISKIVLSFTFSFFYKELVHLFPNRINISVLDSLLTHSRDAVLSKRTITQTIETNDIHPKTGLIYSYWCSGITFGATLINLNIPVVSRIHRGDLYEELYSKNYIPFRKFIFSRINTLFSISKNGVNYLSKKYPTYKNKFKLSRLGIPISKFPTTLNEKNVTSFVIVSCSNIYNIKRVDNIARSLKNFTKVNPTLNLVWHHFGSGVMLDELRNEVAQLPKNMKAILHGHITNKDLMEWYHDNNVDLFINLSKSEGIPVSIMEANSFGIPALATNVGGTSELVSKETGWLINRDFTNKEIFNALEEALKDVPLRIQKSVSARKTCITFFDSEKNYSEFAETIKSI